MSHGKRIQRCKLDTETARKKIEEGAQRCADNIDSGNHYVQSYKLLLKSTTILCDKLGDDAIPAVAHLAYGWMPRIPKTSIFARKIIGRFLKHRVSIL